ncbi:DUF1254 domain-containing protein [Novosphingobium sp. ERW19]|uniref:DUF1254 domain-containing protein n=1 Tax=Novosphingobium sp. ERW19 TaxID=2726186 RepID=UPI0014575CDE|nr:DUF1254 domain-containing protein [Novosphingobium sp. ERW19]NLR40211.1 DUF1254 domain-containing protein [Novosphingobium sp. ERW19]
MPDPLRAAIAALLATAAVPGIAQTGGPPPTPAARLEAPQPALPATGFAQGISAAQIAELTGEAFYWGLNIAGQYELRYVYTQFEGHPAFRGVNRMQAFDNLMDASVRYATTVNASTLYSGGAFDVSHEPVVIEAPAVTDGRYWSVQAADQNVNWFFLAGSQFTGNDAQRYIIVGPHWRGTIPAAFRSTQIVRATSNTFNIAVRVAVTSRDAADMAGARKVVHGVAAAPLGQWLANGGTIPPLKDQPIIKTGYRNFARMAKIVDLGRSMTAVDFIQLLSLSINDASFTRRTDSVKETQTLARLQLLGLREGVLFDPSLLTAEQVAAAQAGFDAARIKAKAALERSLIDMNGWRLQSSLFHDDLDYVTKAGSDDVAWGTPVPYQSHSIAYVFRDSKQQLLDGNRAYTLTLDLANLPPVTEFWELPVYDSAGYFIPNPVSRYSVTSYMLAAGAYAVKDGKVTFYLQPDRPADTDKQRNWLPTARGDTFQLAARFYGPMAPLVDGSYPMPAIEAADTRATPGRH